MNNKKILELNNISKEYNQGRIVIEVLKDLDLEVFEGDAIAIIGSSGSGKSTILHIAGLLDRPDNGKVTHYYFDKNSNNLIDNHTLIRLNYIGFVYQHHHLLKDFSARENVALPRLISGKDKKEAFDDADRLLSELGLHNRIHNMPGQLSGGEQQRVAIARSLINKPKLILADEPTGNLDPQTGEEVFKLFLDVISKEGAALIMVTHNHFLTKKMQQVFELKNMKLDKLK